VKLKALLITAAAVAVAVPTVAGAASGGTTRDSITGGGQAFFDMTDPAAATGAGDTVAFQAQRAKYATGDSTDATGNIQVNRRTTNQVKFHGTFDCLVVDGDPGSGAGTAYASGQSRGGVPFELYVEDGGKGQLERNDMIMLFVGDETANNDGQGEDVCGFSDSDFDTVSMARGNVQVRNRNIAEDAEPQSSKSSQASAPLSLLGL
jgi:hypothetical protein